MDKLNELVEQIELHSVDGIRKCFSQGISPNDLFRNEPLIYELTSEYTRTPRFKDCVQAFVDNGLQFEDKILLSALLNDAKSLELHLQNDPSAISTRYSLRCAYTPLFEVTLLHICAEFNHVACAEILVANGADVNAKAGADEYGFGGQTPIFHTVNQNGNQSIEMLNYLLTQSASLEITAKGFIWGKGYPWETLIPSVNPISYSMMGLLPQMHRDERTISNVVTQLLQHQYGIVYSSQNIPNAYLK
ncbi:MAG: ankyrin repeat domain-containing protein [Chryseolinea sp.]